MSEAGRDLEAAEHQLKGGFYEWACFLAQQAADKAVKAVFQKLGAETSGHLTATFLYLYLEILSFAYIQKITLSYSYLDLK